MSSSRWSGSCDRPEGGAVSDTETIRPTVVLATPDHRHDPLGERLRERLDEYSVVRLRSRTELSLRTLERIKPTLLFFPHWSWLIPEEIHQRFECVIFHMTDVPYGRGGSPLQNLIVRGHRHTVLSAMRCVKEVDAGPVYLKAPLSLEGTAEEILNRAAALMEETIVEILNNRPNPVPQDGEVVEFKRRRPEDGNLAPLVELQQVNDYIRMLDAEGYPPAFLETGHFHFEFKDARLSEGCVEAIVRIRKKP